MKTIGAFSAKTHLSVLLEKVSRGETFVITKRGKPMASLSPIDSPQKKGPMESILAFRKRHAKSARKFSVREINELKAEGRR